MSSMPITPSETRVFGLAERRWLFVLLLGSTCYLLLLSFLNANVLRVSPGLVALVEVVLYLLCIALQFRRFPLGTLVMCLFVVGWLLLAWLIRAEPDPKGVRDLIIPFLFLSLGRYVADPSLADSLVKRIAVVVLLIGIVEAAFTHLYAVWFNTFSFYVNLGNIGEKAAMFDGQMLTLNGYRPEGIGRTLLPFLLGSHRASSVFLEPVSMGNFAVILLAWILSKPKVEIFRSLIPLTVALAVIVLADSRFGLLMTAALLVMRGLPLWLIGRGAILIPLVTLAVVLGIAEYLPSGGDNIMGRITRSGHELLKFDGALLMGLSGPLPANGDMGYAYISSRFGAPLVLALVAALCLLPMRSDQGRWFRSMVLVYFCANLAISGTSIFALKTAGLLWFLFGVLTLARAHGPRHSEIPPSKHTMEPCLT